MANIFYHLSQLLFFALSGALLLMLLRQNQAAMAPSVSTHRPESSPDQFPHT